MREHNVITQTCTGAHTHTQLPDPFCLSLSLWKRTPPPQWIRVPETGPLDVCVENAVQPEPHDPCPHVSLPPRPLRVASGQLYHSQWSTKVGVNQAPTAMKAPKCGLLQSRPVVSLILICVGVVVVAMVGQTH